MTRKQEAPSERLIGTSLRLPHCCCTFKHDWCPKPNTVGISSQQHSRTHYTGQPCTLLIIHKPPVEEIPNT